jgi:2-iminoacetate synthase
MLPLDHTLSCRAEDFIDDARLARFVQRAPVDVVRLRDVIAKSLDKQPLDVEETAVLLRVESSELRAEVLGGARELKERVYGNRIVLFAPLYVGNHCVNDCAYCGFRRHNPAVLRRTLSTEELRRQATALENQGHKRLIVVFGEHPRYDADFIATAVRTLYDVRVGRGEIRRINVNAAPLDQAGFKTVKAAGIGTYQIFMETYHHATYARMHPRGTPKADYLWRLDALGRALEAGQDDVGIGALFGLADWRFDTLALVNHAIHLRERYGCGPHTISFPRLRPASGVELGHAPAVSDEDFKYLIAVLRLAVPYTGLILTARESAEVRREVIDYGVSQIDAGSCIELGGYTDECAGRRIDRGQFELGDFRSLDQVVAELCQHRHLPSFCTACYRLGRTGEHFMEFAIPGFIQRFCTPNALSTLLEYLIDYASPETRALGLTEIERELAHVPEGVHKARLVGRLERIRSSQERDLYV